MDMLLNLINGHQASGDTAKDLARAAQLKNEPGRLMFIDKNLLNIEEKYQRIATENKVRVIASTWSWYAFGCLIVSFRDGKYWVFDGMHRCFAAMRRSDITKLPCILFEINDIKSEAQGFLDANTLRKPVTAHDKHKAMIVVGNKTARLVDDVIDRCGMTLATTAKTSMQINAAHWCNRRAEANPERFIAVMNCAARLCKAESAPVQEMLLSGLWHFDAKIAGGLSNKRLLDSLTAKGAAALLIAAKKSAAHYGNRSERVVAEGMLHEINRKLRNKFAFTSRASDGDE